MTILRDGCVSYRTPPRNLRPADAALFSHELEQTIGPMRVNELTNVRVNGDGLLFQGGQVLRESFVAAEAFETFRKRRIRFLIRNYLLRRHRNLAGRFLWVTDDWSYGYFHWLGDALPRLFAARDLAAKTVLLLPSNHDLEFVRESLKLFDLAGIELVARDEVCVVEELVRPAQDTPTPGFNDALMRELRDFILDSYGIGHPNDSSRRIFISRGGAAKRRIDNEEEVLAVLQSFDFETIRFEEHPFEEQVRIAAGTKYLVSNHGAGLTNMLFMPEGGRVLELRRREERERNCFFNLASTARLGYYYQSCPQRNAEDAAHGANVVVDVRELRLSLHSMLKHE